MHLLLHAVERARTPVNTDIQAEGEHPSVAHFRSRSAFEALDATRISCGSNHTETIYTRPSATPL